MCHHQVPTVLRNSIQRPCRFRLVQNTICRSRRKLPVRPFSERITKMHIVIFQYSCQFVAPFAYSPEKCKLDHHPSYSFGGKYNLSKPSDTPCTSFQPTWCRNFLIYNNFPFAAPTAYAAEKVNLNQSPAYSFGVKAKDEKYIESPGNYGSCRELFDLLQLDMVSTAGVFFFQQHCSIFSNVNLQGHLLIAPKNARSNKAIPIVSEWGPSRKLRASLRHQEHTAPKKWIWINLRHIHSASRERMKNRSKVQVIFDVAFGK